MPFSRRENARHATLLFRAEGVNVQTADAEEKRTKMRKLMMMMAVLSWFAMCTISAFANAKSDWMALHDNPKISLTNTIVVGSQTIHTRDLLKKGIHYMVVCPGVELVLVSQAIWTLRMSGNVTIDGGISSDRSLAIELMPGSFTHVIAPSPYRNGKPSDVYGIIAGCGLLIHGCGTLSVSHEGEENFLSQGSGISAGNVLGWNGDIMVTKGASVRVQTWGSPAVHTSYGRDVQVVGALLETTGGAVIAGGGGCLF